MPRAAPFPASRQPPPATRVRPGDPLARGLTYYASHPAVAWWSVDYGGWGRPVRAGANDTASGTTPSFGKTALFVRATRSPITVSAFVPNRALPLSIMVNFRLTNVVSSEAIIAANGAGSDGWSIWLNTTTFNFSFGGSTNLAWDSTFHVPLAGVDYTMIVTVDASRGATPYLIRRDTGQIFVGSTQTGSVYTPATRSIWLGNHVNGAGTVFDNFDGHVGAFAIWSRVLTQTEIRRLLADPYALWQAGPQVQRLAAATALAASVAGGATGSALLSTGILLAATRSALASASGALTTAIPLGANALATAAASGNLSAIMAGFVNAQASASAALSTGITLAAAVTAAASTAGTGLASAIRLASSAQASATVSASLSSSINALAASSATATVTAASLSTAIQLAATPSAAASASASLLASGKQFFASAQAASTASAALTTGIPLAAIGAVGATTGADLATGIVLGGAGSGAALVTGELATLLLLDAAPAANSAAFAGLSTSIVLEAACAASTSATGSFTPFLLPPERGLMVAGSSRALAVTGSNRTLLVA